MLRRALSVGSPTAAVAALTASQTRMGSYVPKSDMWLDRFDMAREMNEAQIRSGKVPDYNVERFRNMFWRYDETIRRTEAKVRTEGFFFFPILDYEIHKGVMPLFSSVQMRMHIKHHKAYIAKLNTLIKGTQYENMMLDDVVRSAGSNPESQAIFNNAAQHYNHMFFWKQIQPWGSVCPPDLVDALDKQYGSVAKFQSAMTAAGMAAFGSGWLWVVYDEALKQFDILTMPNAGNPLTDVVGGKNPVMVVDLWEHAWYMDYENEKAKYLDNFWKVVDWHWTERQWKKATKQPYEPMKFL